MNANNPPIRVKEILNKYPFLCEEEWLLRHFTMLTGVNLAAMKNDLSEKAVRIYRYFKAQKNPSGQLRTELASIAEGYKTFAMDKHLSKTHSFHQTILYCKLIYTMMTSR